MFVPAITVPVLTPVDAIVASLIAARSARGQRTHPTVARHVARLEWIRQCAIALGREAVLHLQGRADA